MSDNPFSAGSLTGAGFGTFAPRDKAGAVSADEPAWKQDFLATLMEIEDKGFRTYAEDLHDKKIAEMRAKILESMGLTEDELDKMSPDGKAAIEKMIAQEIRERLTAEAALDAAAAQATSPGEGVSAEAQAAPNGFGPGMTLIHAMELRNQRDPETGQ